jgi:argonaute-like protein implicated in RNA metabolism and viral defense
MIENYSIKNSPGSLLEHTPVRKSNKYFYISDYAHKKTFHKKTLYTRNKF